MRVLIFLLLVLLLTSCDSKGPSSLEYIFVKKESGQLDTLHRELLHSMQTDSFNIISYRTTWSDDTFEEEFKFPISKLDSSNRYRFLDETTIRVDDKEYRIIKYLHVDPFDSDGSMLYFYSPEFGVLIFKAAWWGNYDRLTRTGDKEKDRIVLSLEDLIIGNKDFFVTWTK